MCFVLAFSDDENQIKSKKYTRSTTSSAISKIKNEVSNIGNK